MRKNDSLDRIIFEAGLVMVAVMIVILIASIARADDFKYIDKYGRNIHPQCVTNLQVEDALEFFIDAAYPQPRYTLSNKSRVRELREEADRLETDETLKSAYLGIIQRHANYGVCGSYSK